LRQNLNDLATEKPVFFLAWGAPAAEGASYEERNSDYSESHWNPRTQSVEPDHEGVQLNRDHTTHLHSYEMG
jgi:hypothetical protein